MWAIGNSIFTISEVPPFTTVVYMIFRSCLMNITVFLNINRPRSHWTLIALCLHVYPFAYSGATPLSIRIFCLRAVLGDIVIPVIFANYSLRLLVDHLCVDHLAEDLSLRIQVYSLGLRCVMLKKLVELSLGEHEVLIITFCVCLRHLQIITILWVPDWDLTH